MSIDYSRIRKKTFQERLHLDKYLCEIAQNHPSHWFLENPASQNIYLYLTKYVKTISESHFNKKFNDMRILDWGCGKGHVTWLMQKLGANPISCDVRVQEDDSSFGQETPIIDKTGILIDPLEHKYKLPYEDDSFDVVLSFGVLEHVPDDLNSLREINRILTSNGLFFCFFLPYFLSWTQRLAHLKGNYYHDRLYRKSLIYKLMKECDFKIPDLWHRQIFPKNTVKYPKYHTFEKIDQFMTTFTFMKYLATNIEFVACKG
ncbi:MAG: class I SAM-dependent methyltransferase [Candidatus Hatepunaea meridiana]|nr:class I SAM-dependent methyltransferase [Candidatus Hatepunaea meridiana]